MKKNMKQELTEEQDRRRLKGLRILARILVRHRLAHPKMYVDGANEDGASLVSRDSVSDVEQKTGKEQKGEAQKTLL